ncbi:hypothetical protein HD806DRAFT_159956 [Xylariaceae sp. AK1471]|nr:hypothetical protein HD806DRAFT_159956 [Xylariaceae sp. AK1471]
MQSSKILLIIFSGFTVAIPQVMKGVANVKRVSFPVGEWTDEKKWDEEEIPVEHDESIAKWFKAIDVPEPWERGEMMDHSNH